MVTGEDGVFWMHDVAREGAPLRLEGRRILPTQRAIPSPERMFVSPDQELEIVVSLLAEMRVILREPAEADAFAVLDVDGQELELASERGKRRLTFRRGELVEGRSEVLSVSDEAAWLVLYRGDEAVREVPVALYADDEPLTLRP